MIKRVVFGSTLFVALYAGMIHFQVVNQPVEEASGPVRAEREEPQHKIYSFSFSKYTPEGQREIEIEGDSANIFSNTVQLLNVVARAYAEEMPVTITADTGDYDKEKNQVFLRENVIATTADGTRLLTEELDIHPGERRMESRVPVRVRRDNINVQGEGAQGDSLLRQVRFNKNVTVVIRNINGEERKGADASGGPTVITCDGPLEIDYERNIAHFQDNVVAEDNRGRLIADTMDVYYNRITRRVSKIVALGNVVIENPEGNQTFSDSVVYLAEEGRVILGGDVEALYRGGEAG